MKDLLDAIEMFLDWLEGLIRMFDWWWEGRICG